MSQKKLVITAILVFAALALAWLGLKIMTGNMAQGNLYSVSEIRNDDSTYNYVKEECDSGAFAVDSENCVNLRTARP